MTYHQAHGLFPKRLMSLGGVRSLQLKHNQKLRSLKFYLDIQSFFIRLNSEVKNLDREIVGKLRDKMYGS